MTDLDGASLDRILPATSGSADWNDVRRRSGAHQRRRRLVVVLAAVGLVAVTAASAFAMRAVFLDKGFVGLPPIGATPSSPATGELEISYAVEFDDPNGETTRKNAWVYADGRLIWLDGGFVERRLTPEGVELLRSEVASTGLFDRDRALVTDRGGPRFVDLRNGDRFVHLAVFARCTNPDNPCMTDEVSGETDATPEQANALYRLNARLAHPAAWLPDSAWVDSDKKAYVAWTYAVCYGGWPPDQQVEKSGLLALLPSAVRGPLGDAPRRQGPLFGSPGHFRPSYEYCSDMTTDEARAVTVALDDAGIERSGGGRLHYKIEAPGSNPGEVNVWFEPYLPHGEIVCTVCG